MSTPNTAAIIGDCIALAGTVVGLVAAVAASRSAGSAEQATNLMKAQQRSELLRQANLSAHRVIAAAKALESASGRLASESTIEAHMDRVADAEVLERIRKSIAEEKTTASNARQTAESILAAGFKECSDGELTEVLLQMEGLLANLEGERAVIQSNADAVATDVRVSRLARAVAAPLQEIAGRPF